MFRKGLGIDIGTTQISICDTDGKMLLKEPNVAALDIDTGEVLEAGRAALYMAAEKNADGIRLCWPVWDPVVKCAETLSAMLKLFFRRALGRLTLAPKVMISIPCDLTEAQINAVEDAALMAGASKVHFLEAPLCAALGAGLDFSAPMGQMLVHMGASRTEAAMIFLGEAVTYVTVPVGGDAFDMAIARYLKNQYKLLIGKRAAEQIKMRIGMIAEHKEPLFLDVKGRCVQTNEARVVTISSKEMLGALKEPLSAVLDAVISVVEKTGDEMRADISKGGIIITGGGILQGFDQFLADIMGLRTRTVQNASTAAVLGAAKALERL